MKNLNNEVWVGIEQMTNEESFVNNASQEFIGLPIAESLSDEITANGIQANRRDFLKYLGFGLGAATIAASCEIPVRRAIPFVVKPDTIVPGVASYYASSFVNGGDYCAVLVKTREGRPIKIEGNDLSKVTMGGTSARAQASVLSLYDSSRFKSAGKIEKGNILELSWENLDKEIKGKLTPTSQIRILTGTILSPSAKKAISDFTAKFPNTKVITYDAVSSAAILLANEQCFGEKVIPNYRFDQAQVIVSFGADFLGTWISPIEYAAQYAKNRKISDPEKASMSRHIQVESHMSLTGSNADNRILVKPSEQGAAIAALYNEVAALTGAAGISTPKVNDKAAAAFKKTAKELVANKGKSLVVSNSNNIAEQTIVNKINDLLGSYGTTIDFAEASLQRQGVESDVQNLIGEMNSGAVNAIFINGVNPVFDLPNGDAFKAALAKVPVKVSFAILNDETTALCDYVAPTNHYLESWGDAQPKRGHYSLIQPTIAPVFNTRQSEETLLRWADSPALNAAAEQPYYEFVKAHWQSVMFTQQHEYSTFQAFWDESLHNGVFTVPQGPRSVSCRADVNAAAAKIGKPSGSELEVTFFETVNIGAGQYANNPWLLEMADPVSRCVWGNNLSVPIEWDGINDFNGFKGFKDGDEAEIEINGKKDSVHVIRQFGQMKGTVAIALGYGRIAAGPAGNGVGTNVQPFLGSVDGLIQYFAPAAKLSGKTGVDAAFACVQYHHTMGVRGMGKEEGKVINVDEKTLGYKGFQGSLVDRTVIRQSSLKEVKELLEKLEEERVEHKELNSYTLYPGHKDLYTRGHHWGMFIDLNACVGCGACTIACMSENNIPVVGKKEVHRHHEMSWLRIDRYYYGDVENPSVVYQPMMCQHCDNAPCENVCPVNATSHSAEGLNQMTYNRCIGTRYCANNCPYKVRRFNWLDYTTADIFPWNENYSNDPNMEDADGKPLLADNLIRMVLNPDVTVRSRGVIEKCSFCVQRIQEGKLTAKRENRELRDQDIKTACQTSCPTGAIVFGDKNNPESTVSKLMNSKLNYRVLEEVNTQSNVMYSARVNNRDEALDA